MTVPQFQTLKIPDCALFTVTLRTVNCWFPTHIPNFPIAL